MNVVKTVLVENKAYLFSCLLERNVTDDFKERVRHYVTGAFPEVPFSYYCAVDSCSMVVVLNTNDFNKQETLKL